MIAIGRSLPGFFVSSPDARFGVVCFRKSGYNSFVGLRRKSASGKFRRYSVSSGGLQYYQLSCDAAAEN